MKLRILAICAAALAPAILHAEEPAIIARARAYAGPEAALDAVKSVHLTGNLITEGAGGKAIGLTARIDIVFQKPFRESVTLVAPDRVIHSALDDYEGWQQLQTPTVAGQKAIDPARSSQLTLLKGEQVWALRADTLENLWFYRGAERAGGTIQDLGSATVDGIACEKVVFTYSPTVVYVRYFEQATGRLVYSETLGGARIRESGEIIANGVRFPKSIVTVETEGPVKGITSTYTFDKVTVNESVPESLFAVPLLQPVRAVAPPAAAR